MAENSTQEIWESVTGGTVWVHVKDPRNPGGWKEAKVGGKGSQRLTITVDEREFNQDLIPFENEQFDPFKNGLLIRISPKDAERGENEKTDEELIEILRLPDDDKYQTTVHSIESEVVLRRMLELAEKNASMMRHEVIRNVVDDRYSVGKMSRVVKEAILDDAKYSDADL